MVLKRLLVNKKNKYKKTSDFKGQFSSDQNLLKNQISFDDLQSVKEEEMMQRMGEANQEVTESKSKKKKVINGLMFGFNIIIVIAILVYQLSTSEFEPFENIVKSGLFNWRFILVLVGLFLTICLCETGRISILLHQSTKKFHIPLAYKTYAIGRYWDCITPMSAGGQPFQIFYLNKHGIESGKSISIPLARYVIYQIAWLIINTFAIVYSSKNFGKSNLVSIASYIGFGLNTLMLTGVWILSVSKKLGKILVAKILKLLHKIKIVKNYEKSYDKVMSTVNGFQTTMQNYTKNLPQFILLVLMNVVQFIALYCMPYFIYLLLGGAPGFDMLLTVFVYSVLVDLASCFIPLPGGTGMSELSFTIIFTQIFPNGTVFWGLLIWRFMSYYIYLIQGLICIVYDYLVGNKKLEWEKKRMQLEAESEKYKESYVKKANKKAKIKNV